MNSYVETQLALLFERRPQLLPIRSEICKAFELLVDCYRCGGKLLACGNGGSCADSEHIVGELMKSFLLKRPIAKEIRTELEAQGEDGHRLAEQLEGALPAIALGGHNALSTAFLNDKDPLLVYAQQIMGFGKPDDVLLTISTSGNAKNCVFAARTARALGMKIIALTGNRDSALSELADVTIRVPSTETYVVQEYHLSVYHTLCAMLEGEFFSEEQ